MYSRAIEQTKRQMRLTDRQREVVVGTLLGDGHLETKDEGRTYRLKIEHGAVQQLYVAWLYHELQSLVRTPPQRRERFVTLKGRTQNSARAWFNTLSLGTLRFYGQQFYHGGRKVVPRLIRRWLTPLALAVWYMDDGSVKSAAHRTVLLNTQAYDRQSLVRLQAALWERYRIETTQRPQPEGRQLYVTAKSADTFLQLIAPMLIPTMRYKIPKVWLTSLPKQ